MAKAKEKVSTLPFVLAAFFGKLAALGNKAVGAVLEFTVPTRANNPVHHILNVDVSYSMSGFIAKVILEVCRYVDQLPERDFITIQRFSGEGDAAVVIGPIQATKANRELIKREARSGLRLIGNTVFEESFELARRTIHNLTAQGVMHIILTLTDGSPVPFRRSVEGEKQAAYAAVKRLGVEGVKTSFGGSGIYYDEDFMLRMRDENGGSGLYAHINYHEDLGAFYADVRDVAWDTQPGRFTEVEIFANGKKVTGKVLRTTPSVSNIASAEGLQFEGLYKGQARLCFEAPEGTTKIRVTGKFDGEPFAEEVSCNTLSQQQSNEFVIAYAAYAFAEGKRDEAIKIFTEVGADELLVEVENALAKPDRLAAAAKLLNVPRKDPRLGIGQGLSTSRKCIANFMTALTAGGDVLWHLKHEDDPTEGGYERHGLKQLVSNFKRDPNATTVRITGFGSADERMNLNFNGKIAGWWIQADKSLKPGEDDRSYGIVVDGALHTPVLKLTVPEKVFVALQGAEFIPTDEQFNASKVHTFDLRGIPIVLNRGWSPVTLNLGGRIKDDVLMTFLLTKLKEAKVGATSQWPKRESTKVEAKDIYFAPARTYELNDFDKKDAEAWYNADKPIAGYTKTQVEALTPDQAKTAHGIVHNRRSAGRYIISCIQIGVEGQGFERYFKGGKVVTRKGAADRHVSTLNLDGHIIERRAWDKKCEWS